MIDLKAIRIVEGTKISHDYTGQAVNTFSYRELMEKGNPAIGIPGKQNGLIIIDVDVAGADHKNDGTEWWTNFAKENDLQPTYTVRTQSGGFHFYYKLPAHIDPDLFSPPAQLAPGVDLKYNGWVAAPPTAGYDIEWGTVRDIADIPIVLFDEICKIIKSPAHVKEFDGTTGTALAMSNLHKPFSDAQIKDLKKRIIWMQTNGELTYHEWRDGLFALKAGVDDPELLDELADMWTHNNTYNEGDEVQAREIIARADKYGSVGPGTIFGIIKQNMLREGAVQVQSPLSIQEVFDKSGVDIRVDTTGGVNVDANETNLSMLLGAMFPVDELYMDIRNCLYMFKGKPIKDTDLVNSLCPMIQSRRTGLGLQKIKRSTIQGGLEVLMTARQKDPHSEWLKSLEWDGVRRIDNFFSNYVYVENSDYVRAVSKNFWLSLAARGINPGCKFDSIIIIEGREGIRKSSLLEVIAGDYLFAPTSDHSLKDMDELRKMHQSVIVELPELLGLIKEDANTIKGFLSSRTDLIRDLYSKTAMPKKRGFVFIGTTNDSQYLRRSMGGRRFWPIKIPDSVDMINTNAIACDREQLFAEAVARVKSGEHFYEVPKEGHEEAVKNKVIIDPLTGSIGEIIEGLPQSFSIEEVYTRLHILGYISKGLTMRVSDRIQDGLLTNGCRPTFDASTGIRRWERTGEDKNPAPDMFHLPSVELTAFI